MKTFYIATLAALIAAAAPAQAEVIDLSTIKCSDVAKMSADEGGYIMVWLHGYYGGQANDTTMDTAAFEEVGKQVGEKCSENPELGLMTAVNQITAENQ